MNKPITIKEIAIKANVSIGTVDRALHNRGRVSEETREKVLKIAKEGNYSSNILARHLKLNKTYAIQIILPKEDKYWLMLKDGIEEGRLEFERMGFTVNYSFSRDAKDKLNEINISQALCSNADGFIIAPAVFEHNTDLLLKLNACDKPYVFVDSKIENSGFLSYIGQDAYKSGILGARLLYDKYLESFQIYIITFSKSVLNETTIVNRIEGFKSFFHDNGINNVSIHEINLEQDNINQTDLYQLLNKYNVPVHIFIPNARSYLLADTLTRLSRQKHIRAVGYDLLPENLNLLNNGSLDFLIHQKPQSQGYLAMQSLYKHLVLKLNVATNQYMPIDIITKENLLYSQ